MNVTAEGHQIIAEHSAGSSLIFIVHQRNLRTGGECFVVNIAHTARYYITWSYHDTEAQARESANRAWLRYSGRERIICAD